MSQNSPIDPPPRAERFIIEGWTHETGTSTLRAHFLCSRFGAFSETVTFPVSSDTLAEALSGPGKRLADLLVIALGVSYFKTAAAQHIQFPALSAEGRSMAEALYTDGLAEFYVRSGIGFPAPVQFSGDISSQNSPISPSVVEGPALVAFGGGKDSYVARSIIMQAGHDASLASVTLSDAVQTVLTATAPSPVLFLSRRLDPKLSEATKNGFNGHVPITAINMLILCLHGLMTGTTQVIFANERSADEPTIDLGKGKSANHQYSKSSMFEALLQRAISRDAPGAPLPYSILRPFSELWIGRAFSRLDDPFDRFTSCNRNFRLAGDATKRWCGECAKCAFTSLLLAPFIGSAAGLRIFGDVFLDRPALQPFYRELLGLSAHKPWDCVGTINESRTALYAASQRPDWRETAAVKTLLPEVLQHTTEDALMAQWDAAMLPDEGTIVPLMYLDAAREISR